MTSVVTTKKIAPYTITGVSVGGVYTSLKIPELGVLFDAGFPIRSFAGTDHIFISHGHGDHVGGLGALLGIRGLLHRKAPAKIYAPAKVIESIKDVILAMSKMQRHDLPAEWIPMNPGDEVQLKSDLYARAFRTFHVVPSNGYQLFRKVRKLKPELEGLPGREIAERRKRGEEVTNESERLEVAYATDTLPRVLEKNPSILKSRVLILECTFLNEKKSLKDSRAGGHIHLDELLEYADQFENDHLVLMHFSLLYSPREARAILEERLPKHLFERVTVFAPKSGPWP